MPNCRQFRDSETALHPAIGTLRRRTDRLRRLEQEGGYRLLA